MPNADELIYMNLFQQKRIVSFYFPCYFCCFSKSLLIGDETCATLDALFLCLIPGTFRTQAVTQHRSGATSICKWCSSNSSNCPNFILKCDHCAKSTCWNETRNFKNWGPLFSSSKMMWLLVFEASGYFLIHRLLVLSINYYYCNLEFKKYRWLNWHFN